MRILLLGATGMVGQGVLRECLLAADVAQVVSIVRTPSGQEHPKLREVRHADFTDLAPLEAELTGLDACFFCLGATSAGKSEAEYTRVTYDVTMAVARPLARLSPGLTFVFVSGAGTDGSERGPVMWARVKGRTENALLGLPFRAAFMFRPAFIQPVHGEVSRTRAYRILYRLLAPAVPLLRRVAGGSFTTTERIGRAMLEAARHGAPKRVLESRDIDALGRGG
jgi:uncharacterized protein YbjT (DUF2867 family)